jgi:RND family efflux transporter MFP subunit
VDVNRANREWTRAVKLKEGGLITGQELDERKSALESAQARVVLAEAQIGQAESQIAEARHNLTKATIRAPIEGIISHRKVDLGDFVDKGTPLFTIVDNRVLDFTASVSALDLVHVFEGQTVAFSVDGLPGRDFHGRLKRVNPLVSSADRSGRIQAEVENTEGILKGGLFARGRVVVEERKETMVLPRVALVGWNVEKATARIFVVDDASVAHFRTVATGLTVGDLVEIVSGMTDNEKVVVRGGFNLREGDRVHESNSGENG